MDRQQRYRNWLFEGASKITAHAPKVVADEHPLVLQGTVWAWPEHQRISIVARIVCGKKPGSIGGPAAQQLFHVEAVIGHDAPFWQQRNLEECQRRKASAPRKRQRMRHGDTHHRANRWRSVRECGPGCHPAPVVAHYHASGEPETLDHSTDVVCGGLGV